MSEGNKETYRRVLGIDPGTIRAGFGLLDYNGIDYAYVASGTFRLDESFPLEKRLGMLMGDLNELISTYQPDEVALENVFYHKNFQSSLKIGYARGVVLAVAGSHGLPITEHASTQIKSSLCGNGRAPKEQISQMVRVLLGFEPQFTFGSADQSDALAICLTHAQTRLRNKVPHYDRSHSRENPQQDTDKQHP